MPSELQRNDGEVVSCNMRWWLSMTNGDDPEFPPVARDRPGQDPPEKWPAPGLEMSTMDINDRFPPRTGYYSAKKSFDLPPTKSFHISTAGDRGTGILHVVTAEVEKDADRSITVDIIARYWSFPALTSGSVCLFRRADEDYSVRLEVSIF